MLDTSYPKYLYRAGYRMPHACRASQFSDGARTFVTFHNPEVRIVRRPFQGRILFSWVIIRPGRGWLVSPNNYYTIVGAYRSSERKMAELKQQDVDKF